MLHLISCCKHIMYPNSELALAHAYVSLHSCHTNETGHQSNHQNVGSYPARARSFGLSIYMFMALGATEDPHISI